jgi:hypothetical protein
MPSQGGVDREVSTKVIVVVATGVELVAPTASVGAATPAEAVVGRNTTPSPTKVMTVTIRTLPTNLCGRMNLSFSLNRDVK